MRDKEDVFDFEKTKNLDFTEIYSLVEDMKKVKKDEWFSDIYSIGKTLSDYAGLPESYRVYGLIEHAPQLTSVIEGAWGIHESWPSIVCSPYRVNIIENTPNNHGAYAVGPYIAYAKHAYSKEKLEEEKKRLGKNLLVFPAHSIPGLKINYEIKNFCEEINSIGEDFDSIRVCLYWKDVLNGVAKHYEKEGYEVVTAGHYYDPLFLSRQKSIIETSTKTMSNRMGSYVGFCIYMNKPHYISPNSKIIPNKIKEDGKNLARRQYDMEKITSELMQSDSEYNELLKAFSINYNRITKKQKELTNKYWGSNEVKTPREMRELLFMLDGHVNYQNQLFGKLIKSRDFINTSREKIGALQDVADKRKETIGAQKKKIEDLQSTSDKRKETIGIQKKKIEDLECVSEKRKETILNQEKRIEDLQSTSDKRKETIGIQKKKMSGISSSESKRDWACFNVQKRWLTNRPPRGE